MKMKRPGTPAKGKVTVDKRGKFSREQANKVRQEKRMWLSMPQEPKADHLPGSADDRFGQVYRKGGARSGVDQPDDSRIGRGYSSPSWR